MKCPHCGKGELIKRGDGRSPGYAKWAYPYGYWDCDNCGRGWKGQQDGTWVSEGAADKEVYDPVTKVRRRIQDENKRRN